MNDNDEKDFSELIGKTIVKIEGALKGSEEIAFTTSDGFKYRLFHEQDCCEGVSVEDVCGDILDLVDKPILLAECVTNSKENPQNVDKGIIEWQESFTWTFYKIATQNGYVTIRWYGESNGYYSEEVSFIKETNND